VRQRAQADANTNGYFLHPDPDFLNDLLEGLRRNEERYGYPSCPCRLASGNFELDRDIVCPCDYRDPDVQEFGCCYCALFMRKDLYEGKTPIRPIPERRPPEKQARVDATSAGSPVPEKASAVVKAAAKEPSQTRKRLWYCKQCGYVCFREDPPYVCPVCKAKREMFEPLIISARLKG
jgi:ferredoxin-thioredoxin reductase catalytic subunit